MKSCEFSYKALHERFATLKGSLKDGICINNILQYASNTIFIAARSKTIDN